ncbi:hexokinase 2 [Striga asiatica]|uniref:Hexokinase 2 n=1 Tax=Striga asiatica TaxID=4170 RepID=A0A5A7QNP7_STRAF|nr:hexokinase 2 [Striga asiatica]
MGITISNARGMYWRILGSGSNEGDEPATGSTPIRALKVGFGVFLCDFLSKFSPNAKANADLPPLLWPERASFSMSPSTLLGSTSGSPVDSQSNNDVAMGSYVFEEAGVIRVGDHEAVTKEQHWISSLLDSVHAAAAALIEKPLVEKVPHFNHDFLICSTYFGF